MKDICLSYKGKEFAVPNRWDALTPETYLRLVRNFLKVEKGELSVGELRIRLLCDIMHWNLRKIREEEQVANLIVLSEQLTFLFKIQYPDNNAALDGLSDDDYRKAVRTDPFLLDIPAASYLKTLDYRYRLDLCFFAQLLPAVTVGKNIYTGYVARLKNDAITCTLTALQYIEARELLGKQESLPLMAAILYTPDGCYDSNRAHELADEFAQLDNVTLHAIKMNFEAINNFLFTRTSFSLLAKFEKGKAHSITTDFTDALYDLSADGLGNVHEVEQMNILTYLRILRKKTIDSVRQLHGMKMDVGKIANEVGLPIDIITKIV